MSKDMRLRKSQTHKDTLLLRDRTHNAVELCQKADPVGVQYIAPA